MTLLTAPIKDFKDIIGPLYLLPIAIIGGIVCGLIGVLLPRFNRWAAIGGFAAGLLALAYFSYFIYKMDAKSPDQEQYLGQGFWIAYPNCDYAFNGRSRLTKP